MTCIAGPKPQNALEQVFYDKGVIGYCGLSSEDVSRGFRQELARIIDTNGANEQAVKDARNRAMTLVELEWDNRGLGGFRGWCKTEGKTAADRFLGVLR